MKKVCIVGASGKLGRYMIQHCLDQSYEVTGVCREQSVEKLNPFKGSITIVPGSTNDPAVIKKAVKGCDGVLTVLVPWGVHQYASRTAQAVLDYAPADARLVFSCGWHITRDGQDDYSRRFKMFLKPADGSENYSAFLNSMTRLKHVDVCLPAISFGPSCGEVVLKKAKAKVCRYGVAM